MADMSALLTALKRKESGPSIGPDDAPPSPGSDAMPEGDDESPDDEATEELNAKIGEALQTVNPALYAKLAKQVESTPDDSEDASSPPSSAPPSPPAGMMS